MQVKLWGVRGSIATPLGPTEYRHKLHGVLRQAIEKDLRDPAKIDAFLQELPHDLKHIYGGNTTCITVRGPTGEENPVIVDCGTGLKEIGDQLMEGPCGRGKGVVRILITHTHWDHIQGIPFFKPLYIPGNEIHFYSPMEDLDSRLIRQQAEMFFPIPFQSMGATKVFHNLQDKEILELGGLKIDFHPLKHPGGCFAYRFRQGRSTFIFATDAEFTEEDLTGEDVYAGFFDNADLMVLDAQYSLNESFGKFDWGHTSNTMAVNCGVKWRVKNLILTHHEPSYADSRLYENFRLAVDHKNQLNKDLPRLILAREGMVFQLGGKGS